MKLTDKERKMLTIMHRVKMVNGKFLPEFEEFVLKKVGVDYEEIGKIIKKLVKEGLLVENDVGDGVAYYLHTGNVSEDMLDEEMILLGYD